MKITSYILVFILSGIFASSTLAQGTPQTILLLTWQAKTYTPLMYEGKALPTPGSQISFFVEAFSGGKPVALTNQSIRWYEQGVFKKAGVGMQSLETATNVLAGNDFKVRVDIPDLPGGGLSKTVTLRVVSPKVVIEAPFPRLQISPKDFFVKATPYFFSIFTENTLAYEWLVNGTALSGGTDPQTIKVSQKNITDSDARSFSFQVNAQNKNRYTDKGSGKKSIAIQPASR